MGALAYLEWRYAVHRIEALLKSPLRLLIWVPYLGFFAVAIYLRVAHFRQGAGPNTATILPHPEVLGAAFAALLGATIALSAGARAIAFRSRAEAVLLSNARLDPLTIVVWLQLRRVASAPMRLLGIIVYLLAIVAPPGVDGSAFVRAVVSIALLGALLSSIQLPAFLLGARGRRVPLRVFGIAVGVIGSLYAIAAQIGGPWLQRLDAVLPIDFAVPVRLIEAGDALSLAGLTLLVAATIASIVVLGTDALPDLYAGSLGTFGRRRRTGASSAASAASAQRYVIGAAPRGAIPGGPFVLFWKDWVGFVRARNRCTLWICGWLGALAGGFAIAFVHARALDVFTVGPIAGGACVLVLVLAPAYAADGLASDVAKPLFWLGSAAIIARIAVWTAARSWRSGLLLGLAPAISLTIAGDIALGLIAIPFATIAFWSLQALGVALYTVLPNPLDARGPMAIGRVVIAALYVTPGAIGASLMLVATGDPLLGIFAAALALFAEGYACVALAAYRLTEFGATLATIASQR